MRPERELYPSERVAVAVVKRLLLAFDLNHRVLVVAERVLVDDPHVELVGKDLELAVEKRVHADAERARAARGLEMELLRAHFSLPAGDQRDPAGDQEGSHQLLSGGLPAPVPELLVEGVRLADPPRAGRVAKHAQVLLVVLDRSHLLEDDPLAKLVVLRAAVVGGSDVVALVAFPGSDQIGQRSQELSRCICHEADYCMRPESSERLTLLSSLSPSQRTAAM